MQSTQINQDVQTFSSIIIYPKGLDFTAALFFQDGDSSRCIVCTGTDPVTAARDVYSRYLDDPYSYSKEVNSANQDMQVQPDAV